MAKNNLFQWNKSSSASLANKRGESGVQAWIKFISSCDCKTKTAKLTGCNALEGNSLIHHHVLKRVQAESDHAAIEAFGDAIPGVGDIGVMQPDDQAIYEAQELLDKWMQDQHLSNLNLELEFKDEKWASASKPMLKTLRDEIDDEESFTLDEDGHILSDEPWKHNAPTYDDDTEVDYEQEAKQMFQKFMSSNHVETTIMSDLGMDKGTKKFKDPRPKMEQRHQMVKERNRARKEKIKNSQRERMMRKDAEMIARKKIQEEEKARKMKQQTEEAAIQRQMAMIRKEMEGERLRAKEEQERRQVALKQAEEQIRFEARQKEVLRKEEEERRKIAEEKMRRRIMAEMEEKTQRQTAKNLRLLHKVFSAWYGVVVQHRVKVGKARAMFDWRCKLRAWNAWRAYITYLKSCKEAEDIALEMKIRYRKEQMAINHSRLKLLRKCFLNWQSWANEQSRLEEVKREQEKKALKMAAFLEAAASGKLWGNDNTDENEELTQASARSNSQRKEEINGKIDEIFQSEEKRRQPGTNRRAKSRPLSMTFNKSALGEKRENSVNNAENKQDLNMKKADLDLSNARKFQTNYSSENRKKSGVSKGKTQSNLTGFKPAASNTRTNSAKDKIEHQDIDLVDENRDIRLNLDDLDSESNTSALGSEDRDSLRDKKELISRKPTVRSDKPVTKPVLLPMEERARQRAERKAALDEKRKRQDQEKLERLKLEQEKLMIAEMQMKKDRLQQKREEERIQRERELEKQRRLEEFKEACKLADQHYNSNLLKRFGLEPWKRLVEIRDLNEQIAEKYHSRTVFRKVLQTWKHFAEESKLEKFQLAEECYRLILLRRSISAWKKYGKHYDILEDMARRHYASLLVKKYFQSWQYYVTNERLIFWSNEEKAEEHDERRLMKSAMHQWKSYIYDLKEERKRQKRKDELRKKVREWLPDFST